MKLDAGGNGGVAAKAGRMVLTRVYLWYTAVQGCAGKLMEIDGNQCFFAFIYVCFFFSSKC